MKDQDSEISRFDLDEDLLDEIGLSGFDPDNIKIDQVDQNILNEIQSSFPLESRPYLVLAERLGLTEEEVLSRVRQLKETGVIRRIGGNFFVKKLGYTSTLCAARVPEEKLKAFVDKVNEYPGVTHNYLRDHDLNVWFTFIAPSLEEIKQSLADIAAQTGVKDIYNLPAEKTYKIKVDFQFD